MRRPVKARFGSITHAWITLQASRRSKVEVFGVIGARLCAEHRAQRFGRF